MGLIEYYNTTLCTAMLPAQSHYCSGFELHNSLSAPIIVTSCQILSVQLDFSSQKLAIEEIIMGTKGAFTRHQVMYYPKFYCELNHIKYFWYDGKSWTKRNCKYSLEELRNNVPKALSQVKNSTILRHYKSCLRTIDFYQEKIQYETIEWKKLTSYKKTWAVGNNR